MAQKELKYFDKRTIDRYREKGIVTDGEIQSHVKALPDLSNQCQWVQMDLHETEIGEENAEMDEEDIEEEEIEDEDIKDEDIKDDVS